MDSASAADNKGRRFLKLSALCMLWAFCLFLRWSFTACRRAISGERISLHWIGFPAILTRHVAGDVGDKQQASTKNDEHDKHPN
jgi:hypothetical protein